MDDVQRFQKFLNRYYNSNEFKEQRLGQSFINTFQPDVEDDNDLFYCKDDSQSIKLIYNKYLHVLA